MTTTVLTGATSGIGRALAEKLAASGHTLVLVGRDEARTRAWAEAVRGRAVVADLRTRAGWAAAGAGIEAALDGAPLDVLVHNAGIWPSRRTLTADGLEEAFAVNHMAAFALTQRLRPHLRAGARVVQVSAGLAVKGKVDLDKTPVGADFHWMRTYASTKLANLMTTLLWAEQLTGVAVNAVHPGVVNTALGDRPGPVGWLLRRMKRSWLTPEQGADSPAWLATAPDVDATGVYFDERKRSDLPAARDAALSRALWEKSEALLR